jgi:ATP-dependent DNA helicase RecG
MNRLLQGDVGAGKTLVAFLALLVAVESGGQGVMMAPTEILARQHLESLMPLAEAAGVRLAILTGRDKGAERAAKLADLAAGLIHILVGTHAVFQKDVVFQDLRLAVVDEQHRFGVAQRMELGSKGQAADVLVMTATPIPRSLALASYGDMDVSVLDEKPAGRKPIRTALVPAGRMDEVVGHLCPRGGRGAAGLLGLPAGRGIRDVSTWPRPSNAFSRCARPWERAGWAWSTARCRRPRRMPRWRALWPGKPRCWWRRR